uniref:Peptidyl-prolyl cis-trans isomerase n=1 Tax=candidate division WOR-3 bacterium TaxID=2052148 RepID=A0A7C4YCP8_UNCW3
MLFLILGITFERIVAVVEKEPITSSYLDKVSNFYPGFPKSEILKKIVDERIIYYAAIKESIDVTDDEVNEAYENNIKNLPQLLDVIKEEDVMLYKNELKYQLYAQKLLGKKYLNRINVRREELINFYNENRDSFFIPASYKIEKFTIEIGKKEKDRLIKRAQEILSRLKERSFDELAIEYSDDITTKYSGGRLGEFYTLNLPPYFSGVDTIPVGKAGIFSSPEGVHIIKVNSRDKGKVSLSHIFLKFNISNSEISSGLNYANELKKKWANGEIPEVDTMELSSGLISEELKGILENLNVGDISEPVVEGNTITIFKIISKKEGGIPSFEEIEDKLNYYYLNKKIEKEMEKIVEEMKGSVYYKILE